MVDSTAGHELLSFMDVCSVYNQIKMYEPNMEATLFVIVMLFGLKNVGVTCQRLVNWIFKEKIGETMEVYIHDMVVKSK